MSIGAGTWLPERPPFVLRGRIITPLAAGGTRFEPDGVIIVDATGRIAAVGPASILDEPGAAGAAGLTAEPSVPAHGAASDGPSPVGPVVDLRPLLLLPGLVDLHAHLPQIPCAGLGSGLHLLDWLERYVYPLERSFDAAAARRVAGAAFAEFAALGTTTVVLYGAAWQASLDEAFRAADAAGIRAVIGRVMMDRRSYRDEPPARRLEVELRESAELCERWHGRDDGRLSYAFTPRFAVSCTADLLRESATLARSTGAYWQTHLSEDRAEVAEVARLFPEASDYVDVYERAGGLGPRAILAHAIHLSARETERIAATGSRLVHCPESNLFLGSGVMPLAHYRAAGISVGLGSDVAGGPSLSLFRAMRAGAYADRLPRAAGGLPVVEPRLGPFDWLRLATLGGADGLGQADLVGSLEVGREADVIAVDPTLTSPLPPGLTADPEAPEELVERLIFRTHPDMIRGAWVRGRLLQTRRADRPPAG